MPRKIKKLKRIFLIIIITNFMIDICLANNKIKIDFRKKEKNIIMEIFLGKQKKNIAIKNIGKKYYIIIPNGTINYQRLKLPKEIKKINFTKNNENLEIEMIFNKKYKIEKKIQKKSILIKFTPKEEFPYELPQIPEKVYLPFEDQKYIGEKISIDLQNADIQTVFRILSEIGNVNIVLGENIQGKITLKVKNVPWDQVLDIIMARFGLGKATINGIIYIAPINRLQKQIEEVKRLKETMIEEKEITPTKREYITINYLDACKLAQSGVIKSFMSKKGSISCDKRSNLLIIKDTENSIESIKELISKIDRPQKQVLIEARIVEVSSNFARNLGIEWYGGYYKTNRKNPIRVSPSTQLPTTVTPNSGSNYDSAADPFGPIVDLGVPSISRLGIAIGHITRTSALLLDMRLSALEAQGIGKIISAPRIITKNNEEAIIRQGYQVPYLELTEQGTATTKFINADLQLTVKPQILPNNEIKLAINIDKSEPDWSRTVKDVPAILTRSAKTFVRVPNGGTVVIGGLKITKHQENYNRVPGLSKIPAVGNLFKNSRKSQEEQELLIFITSKVITSAVEEIDY